VNKLLLVLGKVRAEINASAGSPTDMINLAGLLADRLDGLPDPAHVMFPPKDLATYALVDLLLQSGQHLTLPQMTALLTRIGAKATRLRVWDLVGSALRERRFAIPQPWFETVKDQLADEAVTTFIDNLRAGDSAPTDDGAGAHLYFALNNGRNEVIRTQIQQLLSAGDIEVGTLAARLVSVRRLFDIGATWRLADEVDQKAFDRIAPSGDDPFYHLTPSAFDPEDLSWANRRLAATGRTKRPTEPAQPQPDDLG